MNYPVIASQLELSAVKSQYIALSPIASTDVYPATDPKELPSLSNEYVASPQANGTAIVHDVGTLNRFSVTVALDQLQRSLRRISPDLDEHEINSASKAIGDVKTLISRITSDRQPWADMFDDGIAILQWRFKDQGMMLLFTGNSNVTLSLKAVDCNYIDDVTEMPISNEAAARISSLLSSMFS